MSDALYSDVARFYDAFNEEIDYSAWAKFISSVFNKYSTVPVKLVLDLCCGTGKMTFALRKLGYDMTGVDSSPEMLAEAAKICAEKKIDDVLWLCQDATEFELYGTVDGAVCCLDSINHLTRRSDAARALFLVHNYLVPDGLFIFDVNTPRKFSEVYGQRDFVLEDDGVLVAWRNSYNESSKLCDFYVSTFTENEDGTYTREDSLLRERCYTLRSLKQLLEETGFELVFVSSDYNCEPAADDAERWYICARCKK
ncbi:MAG: class I SAM-dependent methyltransferase [Clostridia bacterium]|nr:class I SAM-dependent methyltransferase [Clostridia bacterium]